MFRIIKRLVLLENYSLFKQSKYVSNKLCLNEFHIPRSFRSYRSQRIIDQLAGHNPKFKNDFSSNPYFFMFAGILNLFGFAKDDESEHILIMTMKRAVLLIQRGEHKKAEQMLHIALRIAQDEQNSEAVTYVHDLLANLAFEQGDLVKAEKLFVSVMQRLLRSGTVQDDNKIIHISLKLANIYTTTKQDDKAEHGFQFCVKSLQNKVEKGANDDDTILLWAMTLDWYARFLLDKNRLDEAFTCFEKAYNLSVDVNGPIHEQSVVLLNDMGTICCLKNDTPNALKYLKKAVEIGKDLPDMEDLGSVYVNLGNIYLKEGLYAESKRNCEEGWKNGRKHNNKEILTEASKCLDELKLAFS